MKEKVLGNIPVEMNDDELDQVTGGAGGDILDVAPPEALAEGLDIGTEIISETPCFKCFTDSYNYRFRVTGFATGGGLFLGECTRCGTVAYGVLAAFGGGGWTIA